MSSDKLRNLDGLRSACTQVQAEAEKADWYKDWGIRLIEFIEYVHQADLETRCSEAFHKKIWEDNPVSAVGQGQVNISAAIADPEFREWLAGRSLEALPDSGEHRVAALKKLFNELYEKLAKYTNRMPRLKIFRVLAALYPRDFTTITNHKDLRRLRIALTGHAADKGPARHANVLARLEEALDPPGDEITSVVDRMRLPWLLYAEYLGSIDDDDPGRPGKKPGDIKLVPLPAVRRRRGITGVTGYMPSVFAILEFCRDGVGREELKEEIRSINPNLKDNTVNTSINVLIGEFDCLKKDGDQYVLTERGEALLESGDPIELVDWFITHILGVDHILVVLRDQGAMSTAELLPKIQAVNPGWNTNWAPNILLKWLTECGVIERNAQGQVMLTDTGSGWAEAIDWEPESLPKTEPIEEDESVVPTDEATVMLPSLDAIVAEMEQHNFFFPRALVQRLHSGVWASDRRHFAVLTGLSGSGKTLLAQAYAESLIDTDGPSSKQVVIVPVQPGWYDPTALLGYVNPLQAGAYVRTPFLEFLLLASADPGRPYTVILDEMNLSRPEQYLAPLLSAMESGSKIPLHREGDILDGVPADVRYPKNLVILGTVNMDETTHGLSDKVLDRAFTIEFWKIDLAQYPKWGKHDLSKQHEAVARNLLEQLMVCLEPARLHFGWRTVGDVLDYLSHVGHGDPQFEVATALDDVIYARVLPKLRGEDSPRFRTALEGCAGVFNQFALTKCSDKVQELRKDLEAMGSARFWR